MYELIQVAQNSYYIQSPAKIGLVTEGDTAYLIDSGNDKDAGKKIKKILDGMGLKLKAIYNTHSHADHIGGNRYLQEQTGCEIYARGLEAAFTRTPYLEPAYLYGANPPSSLRHKFLMAQPSQVEELTEDVLPRGWEMIPLPGHAFDMVGFRTGRVIYLADCLTGHATLEKYRITFLVDPDLYLKTLEKVRELEADWFIPAHADATQDIRSLAEENMACVHEIASRILEVCGEPAGFESILRNLFMAYELPMTFEQHALVGSTVRSYLTYLQERGELGAVIEDNRLLYRRL